MGYNFKDPTKTPNLYLIKLSIDQSVIGKIRILWEKMMNLIYYLETGEELESKVSGNKTKRKVFFQFIETSDKWNHLIELKDILQYHDDKFRTPEFHKKSTLRADLFRETKLDVNAILMLLNAITPVFWNNLMAIISGEEPKERVNRGFYNAFNSSSKNTSQETTT